MKKQKNNTILLFNWRIFNDIWKYMEQLEHIELSRCEWPGIFGTSRNWICYGWNNHYVTKIPCKKQLFMYSCYKNKKKQRLVCVCKKYIKSKISGNIGAMAEYGQFTLLYLMLQI